jgi:hypothetical protein
VLIDDAGQIIAGHGRVAAAKLMRLAGVPILKISHLSEVEKRAYIAEKAGWDREILAIELQALTDLNFEVELTGFETSDIDVLLDDAAEASGGATAPEDDLPGLPSGEAVSRSGDVWTLGSHRLFCGSALDTDAYTKLMGSGCADMVFTDLQRSDRRSRFRAWANSPSRVRHGVRRDERGRVYQFSQERVSAPRQLQRRWLHSLRLHGLALWETLQAGRGTYAELKNLVVWNKTNGGMGSFYRSKHEFVLVWKNGAAVAFRRPFGRPFGLPECPGLKRL